LQGRVNNSAYVGGISGEININRTADANGIGCSVYIYPLLFCMNSLPYREGWSGSPSFLIPTQ
ncbi:hypothetical protein CIK91_03765, partial [Segatella bryantii]